MQTYETRYAATSSPNLEGKTLSNDTNTPDKFVKKETMWVVALIALAVGFLAGVVFSAFKSTSDIPSTPQQVKQQTQQQNQNSSPDQTAQILALEQEVTKNPNNTDAWIQLGNFYFDSQKFDRAITAYSKALELAPNNANVLTDLGVMYRRNGNPKQAIASFDKANQIDPNHPTALFNRGIVQLYDLKDKESAIKSWEELVSKHPDAKAPNGQPISEIITQVKSQPAPQ